MTLTATETLRAYTDDDAALLTASQALPAIPPVYARNMLTAQAFRPTRELRAALRAHADFSRSVAGTTARQSVSVTVYDCYEPHPAIGYLRFQNL